MVDEQPIKWRLLSSTNRNIREIVEIDPCVHPSPPNAYAVAVAQCISRRPV